VKTKPYQHQLFTLKFHLSRSRSADFSEQGTGKTWAAIGAIEKRIKKEQIKHCLVVCPASILHVWANEIDKHSDFLTYEFLKGTKRHEVLKESSAHVFIVSYDSLTPQLVKIARQKCQMVIFDECHFAKNYKAKRTKLAMALAKTPHVIAMSGTPWPNDMTEVFSIFYLVDLGKTFGTNYYAFLRNYFYEKKIRIGFNRYVRKYIPTNRLFMKLSKALKTVAVRFRKDDLPDIPPKIYQEIIVEMSPDQRKYYKSISHDLPLDEFNFDLPPNILVKYEKLQQIASGFLYLEDKSKVIEFNNPKWRALLEVLPSVTAGKKAIVVCRYQYEITRLRKLLKDYNPLVLDGKTLNKAKVCRLFQEDEDHRVLIMQTSCGVGVTLTQADTMIFLTNSWSYAERYQTEDRICRAGQTSKHVLYIDVVCKGTIDERVLTILKKKRSRIERTLKNVKRGS